MTDITGTAEDIAWKTPVTDDEIAYVNFTQDAVKKFEETNDVIGWQVALAERAKKWPDIKGNYLPVGSYD